MMNFGAAVTKLLQSLVNPEKLIVYGAGDWIPRQHLDRLRQYELFRALEEGRFASLLKDAEEQKRLREYGDIGLIVDTSRDAVLGDEIGIDVPGATDEDNPGARARKFFLEQWAEHERWQTALYEGEGDAASVGDAVYELRPEGTELRLRGHDPESFFPVWSNTRGDFEEAYLAWEEPNDGQWLPEGERPDIPRLRALHGDVVLYRRHYQVVDGRCLVTAGWYSVRFAAGAQETPSLQDLKLIAPERDAEGAALEATDTGFADVPLYYVPNIETTRQPWGLPEAHRVYQLILDAQKDHADLQENTYANAFPILFDENPPTVGPRVPGAAGGPAGPAEIKYQPGTLYVGRKIGVVDTSGGNKLLLEHETFLVEKALTNSRTTLVATGRIKPNEVPSGFALVVSLLPLYAKTLPKRRTRRDKLGMMLKHLLRWYREHGDGAAWFADRDLSALQVQRGEGGWPAAMWDDDRAYPSFGSILPMDKQQVATMVRDLVGASAMSLETAVVFLQMAGFPIDDARSEVDRIREELQPPVGAPGSGMGREGIVIPGLEPVESGAAA